MGFINAYEVHQENFQCTGGVNFHRLTPPDMAPSTYWVYFQPNGANVYINAVSGSVASPSAGVLISSSSTKAISDRFDINMKHFCVWAAATCSLNVMYGAPIQVGW